MDLQGLLLVELEEEVEKEVVQEVEKQDSIIMNKSRGKGEIEDLQVGKVRGVDRILNLEVAAELYQQEIETLEVILEEYLKAIETFLVIMKMTLQRVESSDVGIGIFQMIAGRAQQEAENFSQVVETCQVAEETSPQGERSRAERGLPANSVEATTETDGEASRGSQTSLRRSR